MRDYNASSSAIIASLCRAIISKKGSGFQQFTAYSLYSFRDTWSHHFLIINVFSPCHYFLNCHSAGLPLLLFSTMTKLNSRQNSTCLPLLECKRCSLSNFCTLHLWQARVWSNWLIDECFDIEANFGSVNEAYTGIFLGIIPKQDYLRMNKSTWSNNQIRSMDLFRSLIIYRIDQKFVMSYVKM